MPPFFLIIFLVTTGTLLLQVFVLTPLELLRFSLPNWLIVAVLVLVLSWFFGE